MTSPIARAFDLVIFDWAGTMVDFGSRAPTLALMEAFAAQGAPIAEDEARTGMGMAKPDHIRTILDMPRAATA